MMYGLSAFFVGEERVVSEFGGLVMAAEDKHEEAFSAKPSSSSSTATWSRITVGCWPTTSVEAKLDFITTYHMVIEGTLALTGQYFQTMRVEGRGILPGHLEAFKRIAQDEHRHVAYGTW